MDARLAQSGTGLHPLPAIRVRRISGTCQEQHHSQGERMKIGAVLVFALRCIRSGHSGIVRFVASAHVG